MVAQLLGLRLAQLGSAFRGSFLRVAGNALGGIIALIAAAALAWLPGWIAPSLDARNAIDTVVCACVLAAATIVPVFVNRRHLEPRQFATAPARPAAIGAGLLLSTLLSWPMLILEVWIVALIVMRPEWRGTPWALVGFVVAVMLVAILGARVASACGRLITTARLGLLLRAIGTILLLAMLPITVFAIAETVRDPGGAQTVEAASALGWTPFGAPAAAMISAVQGDLASTLGFLSIALAWVLVLLVVWFGLVMVSLTRIAQPLEPLLASRSMGWFDVFSSDPIAVIGARALTYWRRDPRYRVALAAAPIGAALIVVALSIAGVAVEHVALIPLPLLMLLLGWSLHNDIATDSTAIWLHVVSGTRGFQDRLGRFMPALFIGIPLALVGSSVTATVLGDWRALPALIGMNVAVLLVACGVSSISSAVLPYPTTRPNDSPFMQPAVSGSGGGTAQTLSMLVTLALSVFPVWLGVRAVLEPTLGAEIIALVACLGYGAVVSAIGVLIGGAVFDRAGPVYIALTQTFD